jgi:hypothetical protein
MCSLSILILTCIFPLSALGTQPGPRVVEGVIHHMVLAYGAAWTEAQPYMLCMQHLPKEALNVLAVAMVRCSEHHACIMYLARV